MDPTTVRTVQVSREQRLVGAVIDHTLEASIDQSLHHRLGQRCPLGPVGEPRDIGCLESISEVREGARGGTAAKASQGGSQENSKVDGR